LRLWPVLKVVGRIRVHGWQDQQARVEAHEVARWEAVAMSYRLNQLDPDVEVKAVELLRLAEKEHIELVVTQTYRPHNAQAALYAQGRTAPGNIVTHAPPGYSWHEFRRAFDVAITHFPGDMTKADLYDGPWEQVGTIGEQLGLEWGGRWKHPDRPHFQHTGGFTLAHMRLREANQA
jgi:peptidoglycan L-alanyl-D-glutamate endopeptidase CwlK